MKIVCISDTHLSLDKVKIPYGDILIHSGDLTNSGSLEEVTRELKVLSNLPHPYKVLIAGNHDVLFEKSPVLVKNLMLDLPEIIYLQDSEVTLDGVRIYGTPWIPRYFSWAFMLPKGSKDLERKYLGIPENLDILVTHGPPWGIRDSNRDSIKCGSLLLRDRVFKAKPRYHIFGHIHESVGCSEE